LGVFHDEILPDDGSCVYVALQTRLAAALGSVHLVGLRCFTYAGVVAGTAQQAGKLKLFNGLMTHGGIGPQAG
jgi:hypothetical protein